MPIDCAFSGCSGLTSVTIGNGVTTIGDRAFFGCSGLTSVTIPDSVTTIDDYAFYNCSGLTSITLGKGITKIGRDFARSSNVSEIHYNGTIKQWESLVENLESGWQPNSGITVYCTDGNTSI